MSTRESISRYNLIIKKLRRQPANLQEISDYLTIESDLQSYNFVTSKRTFQRDLEDIRSIYNIDIKFDFSRKVYFIDLDHLPEVNERILESFDIFNALNITDRISNFIHFEKRRPHGTENLNGLLHAIKNQLQIRFTYQKYWDDEISQRLVEPYALKEFENRWYVLANDLKNNKIKSFALDRLRELEITKKTFKNPKDFDVNAYYKNSFGITSPNGKLPEEIVLSFDPLQGKYLKSLPLHESQVVLTDNEEELKIGLNLVITHDFLMEILSYGENVKVIKPESLVNVVKAALQNALNLY